MTDQTWLNANLVRLRKAVLCANCDVISEGVNGHCAACGSEALLNLNRLLGGAVDTELSFTLTKQSPANTDFVHRPYLPMVA
jgi:hypothetical protein